MSVIRLVAPAQANALGQATFTFDPIPLGDTATGTVAIPGAPALAAITVQIKNGPPIGTYSGQNPWGPVQALGNEQLQLVATGLTPNAQYTATWIVDEEAAGGGFPSPLLGSVQTTAPQVVLEPGAAVAANGTYQKTLQVPASVRAVCVVYSPNPANAGAGSISVVGGTTGYAYVQDTLPPAAQVFVAPVFSALDTTVVVTVNTTPAATIYVVAEQEAVSAWVQSSDLAGNAGQALYVKNRTVQQGPTGGITAATPLGVLELGGLQHALVSLTASPTVVLPAPGGVNPYRLHAIEWDSVNSGGSILLAGVSSNARYFRAASGVTDGFALLGGLLAAEGLEVFFATAGQVTLHYDNVHVFGMNPWPPL